MRNSDVMAWWSRPAGVKPSIWCVCSVQGSVCVTCVLVCISTSVFGHHGGVETLRLLEGDSQRGATAHAQTDHRRGLRGTWAGAQRGVSVYVKCLTLWLSAGPLLVLIVWRCSSRSQVFTWSDFGSEMKPVSVSSPERRRSTRQSDGLQPETRTWKCYDSAWLPITPPPPPHLCVVISSCLFCLSSRFVSLLLSTFSSTSTLMNPAERRHSSRVSFLTES